MIQMFRLRLTEDEGWEPLQTGNLKDVTRRDVPKYSIGNQTEYGNSLDEEICQHG